MVFGARPPATTSSPAADHASRAQLIALAALVLLALAVRLPGLNESLWFDELWSTRVKLTNVGQTLRLLMEDRHPPLYTILSFTWIRIFGDSEISVRAMPMLSGLATVALMPSLGEALATRRAGWFAGVLLALSPVHIWYSQEGRSYALIMLLAMLICFAWLRLDTDPSRVHKFVFIALCIVVTQLHYFAIALPALVVLVSVWNRRHRSVALVGLFLSALGIGAYVAIKARLGELHLGTTEYLRTFDAGELWRLWSDWFTLGGSVSVDSEETAFARLAAVILIVASGLAILAWLGVGWREGRRDRWMLHVLFLIAVPGLLLALGWIGQSHYYIERSALTSLPFYWLAVASGVFLLKPSWARRSAIGTTLLTSALVLMHYHARRDAWTVYKPNADWRSVVDPMLRERGGNGQPLVIVSGTPMTELVYYVPGAAECMWPPDTVTRPPGTGMRARFARLFPKAAPRTCGSRGDAAARLYFVVDSSPAWVADVRRYESTAKPLLLFNSYWEGPTRNLMKNLQKGGFRLRLISSAKGLEVFAIE